MADLKIEEPGQRDTPDVEVDAPAGLVAGGYDSVAAAADEVVEIEAPAAGGRAPAESQTIQIWLFRDARDPQRVPLGDVPHHISDDANFVWIDLSEYAEDDLRDVADVLHLHPSAVHAALSQWQRPRLDVRGADFFVSTTVARLDSSAYRVAASQLDLFVGRNLLVSAHKLPLPFAERVNSRARRSPELVQHDSSFMLFIVLDEMLAHYEHLREQMQADIEHMEERALTDLSDDFLRDLVQLKRYAFALSQLAEQHRSIFDAFVRPDFPFVGGDDVDMYFRDLDARLHRLLDTLHEARDAVNGAFDIYVSHVAHRTNQVIKLLTIVSTTLLPISVILTFFGTSFTDIAFLHERSGFVVMLATIGVLIAGILTVFKRQGWL